MKRTLALITCALTLAFVGGTTLISAENGQKVGKATVRAVKGNVTWQVNGGPLQKLRVNQTLDPGATVITGPDSHADLSVNGVSSVVRISPDSKIQLDKMNYWGTMREGDRETYLHLQGGEVLGNVKKISGNSRYEIETPHGVAGIRGTDFQITINIKPDGSFAVTFTSVTGQVIVSAIVSGSTVTHILQTGQSWTPGDGDVRAATTASLVVAQQIIDVLNRDLGGNLTLPPPPGVKPPFDTGGEPHPSANTTSGSTTSGTTGGDTGGTVE
ncbi:MAG TPA: FecR family protein [Verrucomicrobiae bacterium]|jgi:hypothetical protein|nr:FecR family protein [Verrucomicrobiae bacterium]